MLRGTARWLLLCSGVVQGAIFKNKNSQLSITLYWGTTRFRNSSFAYSRNIFYNTVIIQTLQKLGNILKSHTSCYTAPQWHSLVTFWPTFYQSFLFACVYFTRIGITLSMPAFFNLGSIGELSPTEKDLSAYFLNSPKDGLELETEVNS